MQEEIELYNKVLKEEEELVFAHISQDDLIRLGFMIHQANQGYPGPVAVLIRLNGKDVFSCYPEGTGAYHRMWLERKANTVHVREMSSLRAYLLLQQNNEDIEKDWMLPAQEYAACGGGFPIRLKNGSVVGEICTSGLSHIEDHEILVKGLKKFFKTP